MFQDRCIATGVLCLKPGSGIYLLLIYNNLKLRNKMLLGYKTQKGDTDTNQESKENLIKNLERFLIPEFSLYCWIQKKRLDEDNQLSDDEWYKFIDSSLMCFAEDVHIIAKEYLKNWISGNPKDSVFE